MLLSWTLEVLRLPASEAKAAVLVTGAVLGTVANSPAARWCCWLLVGRSRVVVVV